MSDKMKSKGGGGKGRPPEGRGPRGGPPRGGAGGGKFAGKFAGKPAGKPPGPRGAKPARAAGEDSGAARRIRVDGEKPFRARSSEGAPSAERKFGERKFGDRPPRRDDAGSSRPPRTGGDKPYRARSDGDAPRGERKFGERKFEDRPARRDDAGSARPPRAGGDKPFRARSDGDAPRPARKFGEKPAGDRPFRGKPAGDRKFGGKPSAGGDRPFRGRTEDRQRSYASEAAPRPEGRTPGKPTKEFTERIAKVIARAGLCSRRDAETWIEAGRVSVNGEVLTSPALDVGKRDNIMVDGVLLPSRERTRLFLYHKPRGLVTTARDPEGRPTVFERLPPGLPRVVTIGRLDINTEGLLLLTNDGGLSRVFELPETGWLRRYRVRAYGEVNQADLDALKGGVTIDGMHYGPIEAEVDRAQGDNVWITLGLREGKNREVKRILEHLGLQVNRLIRLSFGPFQLGDLPEGAVEEVRTRVLADQLGPELAEQAGVDFEAPVFIYDEEDDFRPKKKEPRAPREERSRDDRPKDHRTFGGDAPQRRPGSRDRDERPAGRSFGRGARDAAPEEKPRPARRHPTEPLRSIWRAEDADEPIARPRQPRRGADPKAARSESGERAHERAGKVQDRRGRAVLVERIKTDPAARIREPEPAERKEKRAERPPRREHSGEEAPRRSLWGAGSDERKRDDRPGKDGRKFGAKGGGKSFGSKSFGDRPPSFGGRPGGDKPFRGKPRADGGGGSGRPGGDRPRGRPAGGRPAGPGGKGPRGPRRDG